MPTYEYRCKDCSEQLEVVQAFTDDALTECPACGGNLKKVFSNVGIAFKGSGFYKNDARSDSGGKSSTKSTSSTSSESDSSSSSSSESPSTSTTSDTSSPSTPAPSKSTADAAT